MFRAAANGAMFDVAIVTLAFLLAWYILVRVSEPTIRYVAPDRRASPHLAEVTCNNRIEIERNNESITNLFKINARTRSRTSDSSNDCAKNDRYCSSSNDCLLLCKRYKYTEFLCDVTSSTCVPVPITDKGGDGDEDLSVPKPCDTKNGEYAVLVGFANIGAAVWQCIQIYSQYVDRSKFCENGVFDMNANVREPSFRDCECPSGTVRAVHSIGTAYDNSLPHCVREDQWQLLKFSMTKV